MNDNQTIENIRKLSSSEIRSMPYSQLTSLVEKLSTNEIIELSNLIGYPVFTRLCMDKLKHKFVLLQDGAAAVIMN